MNEELKKYLVDIREAVSQIDEFVLHTPSFREYQNNLLVKAAVERKLEIIGEAVNKLCKLFPDIPITAKHKMISLRNRIIHAYDAVDDILIWEVVRNHLPRLRLEVEVLLRQPPDTH